LPKVKNAAAYRMMLITELASTIAMKLTGPLSDVATAGPTIVLVNQIAGRSRKNDAEDALPNAVNSSSTTRTNVKIVLKITQRKGNRIPRNYELPPMARAIGLLSRISKWTMSWVVRNCPPGPGSNEALTPGWRNGRIIEAVTQVLSARRAFSANAMTQDHS
jgi:hypothetical protein